jgi:hypothetical protein
LTHVYRVLPTEQVAGITEETKGLN